MDRKKVGYLVITLVAVAGIVVILQNSGIFPVPRIVIEGNSGFGAFGFRGEGTAENPYIIEYRMIVNILDDGHNCIYIRDTTAYFIIRDCTLSTGRFAQGIFLNNVENAVIEDCEISNAQNGILVQSSNNVEIQSNTIRNCNIGLWIVFSTNYEVSGNSYFECITNELISDS